MSRRRSRAHTERWLAVACALTAACGGDHATDAGVGDAAVVDGADGEDGPRADSGAADGSELDGPAAPPDGAGPSPDAAAVDAASPDAAPPDASQADAWSDGAHVDIYIDNFCNVDVIPGSFTVPAGETLALTWHNNSVDYEADVWLSYGGGYLGLAQGGIWADSFEFCSGPGPYEAGADVGPAGVPNNVCPHYYVQIHCL